MCMFTSQVVIVVLVVVYDQKWENRYTLSCHEKLVQDIQLRVLKLTVFNAST